MSFSFLVISQDRDGHNKFRPIPPIHCYENAWKLHIWFVSLSQNGTKLKKHKRPWPKCNQFHRWSGNISMSNFKPFLLCVLKKRKPHIWPVSLSQNGAKMRKINRWWPKSNQFSRWSGYISNFRSFKVTTIKLRWGIDFYHSHYMDTR